MRTEKELKELLHKHSAGRCTAEEERLLEAWFDRIGEGQASAGLSPEDRQRMLNDFNRSPRFADQATLRYLKHWRSVAAAAILIGIIVFSWLAARDYFSGQQMPPVFVQLETGSGQVKQVMLPDSTIVWLNARTQLAYHPDFANHREIRLSGEALFEVHHDKSHPFTVLTADSLQTTVLGTQFNIRSYAGLHEAQVTVLSGRVQVAQLNKNRIMGVLTPNQALRFDRRSGSYTQTEENALALAGWHTGEWELKDKGIEELTLLLANQYGITVINRGRTPEALHVNANFTNRQSAREIVSVFSLLAGCRYRWKDSTTVELY